MTGFIQEWEEAMHSDRNQFRRILVARLLEHLEQEYGITQQAASNARGVRRPHALDALLAFKTDPCIEELHQALERLADGSFGFCLSCKQRIQREALLLNPVQRICAVCEEVFLERDVHEAHHAPAVR